MGSSRLSEKVVWITGAGRGLGRAMALHAASEGAVVAATARSTNELESLVAEGDGLTIHPYPASVASTAEVEQVCEQIVADHGRLDGLVNNAGISPTFSHLVDLDDDTLTGIFDVNVIGAFRCLRAAGRHMLAQGSGSAVNISSVHATSGFARLTAYAATKGAIDAMTRSVAVEWARESVRVNALAPGYFHTDLSAGMLDGRWREGVLASTPLGRIGSPPELAAMVTFLLSDESQYITGSVIPVDGGWTAR